MLRDHLRKNFRAYIGIMWLWIAIFTTLRGWMDVSITSSVIITCEFVSAICLLISHIIEEIRAMR